MQQNLRQRCKHSGLVHYLNKKKSMLLEADKACRSCLQAEQTALLPSLCAHRSRRCSSVMVVCAADFAASSFLAAARSACVLAKVSLRLACSASSCSMWSDTSLSVSSRLLRASLSASCSHNEALITLAKYRITCADMCAPSILPAIDQPHTLHTSTDDSMWRPLSAALHGG